MRKIKLNIKWINLLLLFLFSLIGFLFSAKATHGLVIPADDDCFRDMGIAENILKGYYFTDSNYLNEYAWYNPLLQAFEALLAKMSGINMNIIITQTGKYINLLIPISMFYLCSKLFNSIVSIASVAATIFLIAGADYATHTSGYTYIMLPICFAQAFFYLTAVLIFHAFTTGKSIHFVMTGLATGIIFLLHSAPALLLCIMIGGMFGTAFLNKEIDLKKLIIRGAFTALPFLIVAFPLLYNIIGHYHLQIKNHAPGSWVYILFRPGNGEKLLWANMNIVLPFAIIGLIYLLKTKTVAVQSKRLVLCWLICSVLLFIRLLLAGLFNKQVLLPTVDIYFYLKAVEVVLFGIGVKAITDWLYIKIKALHNYHPLLLFYCFVIAVVVFKLPGYRFQKEFTRLPAIALRLQQDTAKLEAYKWILRNTDINDVILCSDELTVFPVMATGRKMVVTGLYYSNPYVDYKMRKKDRDDMLTGMPSNIQKKELFEKYKVDYVIFKKGEERDFTLPAFSTTIYKDRYFIVNKIK